MRISVNRVKVTVTVDRLEFEEQLLQSILGQRLGEESTTPLDLLVILSIITSANQRYDGRRLDVAILLGAHGDGESLRSHLNQIPSVDRFGEYSQTTLTKYNKQWM